jgi:hypothetical protein
MASKTYEQVALHSVALLRNPQERAERRIEGLNSTSRIIVLGVMMDVIYQLFVFETFYPNEALVVGCFWRSYRIWSSEGWPYACGAIVHLRTQSGRHRCESAEGTKNGRTTYQDRR